MNNAKELERFFRNVTVHDNQHFPLGTDHISLQQIQVLTIHFDLICMNSDCCKSKVLSVVALYIELPNMA